MFASKERRFRFAPSPNGKLHLGHACSALLNHDLAQDCSGTLLLRMEDTDTQRCKRRYEGEICDDLNWLGIRWQQPVRRQSDHLADYYAALDRLKQMQLVYPSAMSRREIAQFVSGSEKSGTVWPRDPDGAPFYPGQERTLNRTERKKLLAADQPIAWRLDMQEATKRLVRDLSWQEAGHGPQGQTGLMTCDLALWGDIILARADGQVAYHLAVVVDDDIQHVTDIVRGHDLFHATAIHRLLQTLLGLPEPRYQHHYLLSDSHSRKLSKSDRDLSLRALRSHHQPGDIRRLIEESPKI